MSSFSYTGLIKCQWFPNTHLQFRPHPWAPHFPTQPRTMHVHLEASNLTCPKQNSWFLCTTVFLLINEYSVVQAPKHTVYLWIFFFPHTLYPIYQQQLEVYTFKAQIITTSHYLFHDHPGTSQHHLSPTFSTRTVSKLICFWSCPTMVY